MKKEAPDHPKMIHLCRLLGVPRIVAVGLLERLFHYTSAYAKDGNIGAINWETLTACIGWDEYATETKNEKDLRQALCDSGWLQIIQDGVIYVAGWHKHCEDRVDISLAREGKLYANGSPTRRKPPPNVRTSDVVRQNPTMSDNVRDPADNVRDPADNVRGGDGRCLSTIPYHTIPYPTSTAGGGDGPDKSGIISELLLRIGDLFKRSKKARWSYLEESEVVQLAQRKGVLAELDEIERFYANKPTDKDLRRQSVITLLQNWTTELDKARSNRSGSEKKDAPRREQFRGLAAAGGGKA